MKPIVLKIKTLSASERKITAEIIDCIREIDLLKIHLEMGYPSLMEFLVQECGYSETAALRRIDAARVMNVIPEVRADLKAGILNLSQVSIVAQSVRQKEKLGEKVNLETKKELINAVKHKRTYEIQKITAQILDLPVLQAEKTRVQANESVRVEMSFTKAEMESVQKAKELLGHIRPGMSIKELVVLMAERVIRTKNPAREVRARREKDDQCVNPNQDSVLQAPRTQVPRTQAPNTLAPKAQPSIFQDLKNQASINQEMNNSSSATELNLENSSVAKQDGASGTTRIAMRAGALATTRSVERDLSSESGRFGVTGFAADNVEASTPSSGLKNPHLPTQVTASVRRQVFQRDQECQWRNPFSNRKCGSRHLLEIDHKISKWAGGTHELENLELKCRAHNQWKYRREAGVRSTISKEDLS